MKKPPNPCGFPDGIYQVKKDRITAGFVVRNGKVIDCAPILRKKLGYWMTIAERIAE